MYNNLRINFRNGIKVVKVVSFDLDGTLVDYSFIDAVWFDGIPKLYAERREMPISRALEEVVREYDEVGENRLEWYDIKYWFERFGLDGDWKKLLLEYRGSIRLYPDVRDTLEELGREFKLIINSNCTREFMELELEHTNIGKYLYRIFSSTSDFHEVRKTGAYYAKICKILKIQPEEMVHVGDNWRFDFLVPSEVGIRTIYLDRGKRHSKKKESSQGMIIYNLNDLKSILRGLENGS